MTELRRRMIEVLQLRGQSDITQKMYVRAVRKLAEHYHKSPDQVTEEELRQYFLYLKNVKKFSRFASTIALCGIKFFFHLTNNTKVRQVCRLLKNVGKSFIEDLADFLQTERGRKAYAASPGLCLRHLDLLLGDARSNQLAELLIGEAARRFAEIAEDVQNYALKRDAREGYALNQDEKDAWWRGLVHPVGDKKVAVGWDDSVEL